MKIDALTVTLDRLAAALATDFPGHVCLSPKSGVGRIMDSGAIREEAKQLLASLQHTKDAEIYLVLESVNTDIGGGD